MILKTQMMNQYQNQIPTVKMIQKLIIAMTGNNVMTNKSLNYLLNTSDKIYTEM